MSKEADRSKSYNITDFLLPIATKISFSTLIKAFFCVNKFFPIFPGEVLYFFQPLIGENAITVER